MDRLSKLVIAAALSVAGASAHAGYAWPADPPGFTRSGAWGSGYGYSAGANDSTFGKIIHQSNGLKYSVNGRAVTMPVSYRLAQNAPRFAAQAVFLHPGIRTAAGIASWLLAGKVIWDEVEKVWTTIEEGQDQIKSSYEYGFNNQWFSNENEACQQWMISGTTDLYRLELTSVVPYNSSFSCVHRVVNAVNGNVVNPDRRLTLDKREIPCPTGWTKTPAGCLSPEYGKVRKIETVEDFKDILAPKPMPETVPQELPPNTPLPVEPDPKINPEPGQNPQHRPLFVPTGDPVPNPNYDPNAAPGPNNQPWIQPGTKLNPSPAVNDPWRMDVKPVDRPVPTPDPMPEPQPDAEPRPDDKPKPEDTPGLCDLYPDILACVKLDEPKDSDLQTKEIEFNVSPDSGWGADNAACPAPKQITVQGRVIPIPYDLFCTWASGLRPVILALAWLSAAFIILGAREEA